MRNLYVVLALMMIVQSAGAQVNPDRYHGRRIYTGEPAEQERTTGQSGTGSNIDVVYHRALWRIRPDSLKAIRGAVTTYFVTTENNVSQVTFDLNSAFNNASLVVQYHGSNITRSLTSNILTITLPAAIPASGTLDSVTINYYGVPPAVSGAAQGYQLNTSNTATRYISTLSESYEDRDWWPCKADMQDKIDSMDISVSTRWSAPDTFWVATNGVLVDSTITGTDRVFTFKTRYPMASYLVAVSVARYNRYYRGTVNIGGTELPVVYYLFRGKTTTTYNNILNKMDQMTTLLAELSNKFGHYPFKNEKHGFYEGLDGSSGMEHQTFSAMASNALTSSATLAHELMHQWFGNKTTFASWADLWLAEGFARYGEVLGGELVPATGINPVTELSAARTAARNNTTTPARITSYATSNQVWTGANISAVYDRGCMAVSMLRALVGDDMFFQACTNYLDENIGSGYSSATSDTLKAHFERLSGADLDPYFDTYVKDNGHPTYTIHWQPYAGGGIHVSVGAQTVTGTGAPSYFNGPVVLRIQATGKDTTIVFYDMTNGDHSGGNLARAGNGIEPPTPGNRLFLPLSFVPSTVTFDPGGKLLAGGSTLQVSTLDLQVVSFNVSKQGASNLAQLVLDGNESNTSVILERSINGTDFHSLGEMVRASTTGNANYNLNDNYPVAGNNYYRAKFYNVEGQALYSRVVKIAGDSKGGITLLTNPVSNDKAEFILSNDISGVTTIFVYDEAGKLVMKERVNAAGQRVVLNVAGLSRGVYMVSFSETASRPVKMLVQ